MPEISIRAAIHSDVAFLEECAAAAYSQYVKSIGQKPAPMIYDFAGRLDAETIEVIEFDGNPAGYMVWRFTEDVLFLDSIALLPVMKGKGLARSAFDYLEARAKHHRKKTIELYTNIMMTENLTLYPHLGFLETGRKTEDGFERVYFAKKLTV